MRPFNLKHWSAVICSNAGWILCLVMPILSSLLCGCAAAAKSYNFSAHSITKVSYNPNRCTEQPNGTFKCKDVILTVSAIETK